MNDLSLKSFFFHSLTSYEVVNSVILSVPLGMAQTVLHHNGMLNVKDARIRREVYWNCGKALATHLFICRLSDFSESYANSSKEPQPIDDGERNEGRLHVAKEAFKKSIHHGIPIHVFIVLFKECQLFVKWAFRTVKYRYDMTRMNPDEREFYSSNWLSVWKEMTRDFLYQSGMNVATALASILLQGIGMGVSYFLFPHLSIQFNNQTLMCTISMLF